MGADAAHSRVLAVYNAIKPLPRGYALKASDPWCAAFVSAVAADCGLTDVMPPECGCGPMTLLYAAHLSSRWREDEDYTPRPGDVIFYRWDDPGPGDCRGEPDHVGIVEAVLGGVITVIEGNFSGAVRRREVPVNGRYIRGYGLPDYAGKASRLTGGEGEAEFSLRMERWLESAGREPPHPWSAEARAWAEGLGIVRGVGSDGMRYAAPCTREEAAVMLYRLAKLLGKRRA